MTAIRYFLISMVFILSGIIYSREIPKVKVWLLYKIQVLSRRHAGAEIKAESIGFNLLPPGVTLNNVDVVPLGQLASTLAPTKIRSVSAYLSPTSLLAGRFEIGTVTIAGMKTSVFLRKSKSNPTPKKIEIPWAQFIDIPIRKMVVTDAEVRAKLEDQDLAFQLSNFGFRMEKTLQAAKLEIFAPHNLIKHAQETPVSVGISTRIILEQDAAEISALKVVQGSSFVIARGVARGPVMQLEWTNVNGRTVAHLDLKEISALAKMFKATDKLPSLSGNLNFEIIATQKRSHAPTLSAEIETQNLDVAKFKLGNLHGSLRYSGDILRADEIKLQSAAGNIRLQDLDLRLGDTVKTSGRVIIDSLELRQLLANLDVGNAPVHLDVTGRIPCEGTLMPQLKIECAGEIKAKNLRVYTEPENKTIVAVDDLAAISHFTVDKNKIIFPSGVLNLGGSQGEVQGSVDYEKGFTFNYHSSSLNFKDIRSLADLKYSGSIELTGSTFGTGHTGVIDTQAKMRNFWFEDYFLGNGSANVRYEKSNLTFSQVQGKIDATNYTGQVAVKLNEPTEVKAHLDIPRLELADLVLAFSKKVDLPFAASGSGSGQVDLAGPFSLSKLTYTLKSSVSQGIVAKEAFSDAHFSVHGVKGHAFADDVSLKKGDGAVRLTGDVLPSGIMNLAVRGTGLHLTDLQHVQSTVSGLDGRLNVDMTMREHILHPQLNMKGRIAGTTINEDALDDSEFSFDLGPQAFRLNAQIFAGKIRTSFLYPFISHAPSAFKFESDGWDFSNLMTLIGGRNARRDYESSLTARINLSSEQGGFWESRGEALVSKFYVRHGTSQMKNVQPVLIKFNDGLVSVEHFQIEGDNTQVSVTGARSRKDQLNFNVNGRVDLSLLSFLTPFFKEMTGQLTLSTQLAGTSTHPELLGSAFISKGFIRLDALPHAFENINADFLFSQTRILINKLNGHFAGGDLSGSGSLVLQGYRDFPLDLTGELLHASLSVPEGIATHGNMHFTITGDWFPYLFKADYAVDSGLFSKNFADASGSAALKRSTYLPNAVLQKEFYPLEFDLTVHLPKNMAVKNALMDAEVHGELQIKGDPQHPILKGEIDATPGGKIFFHDTPFIVNTARIKFTDPNEINPTIYTLATSRVRDWDINLIFQGTAQKNEIKLSSSPPLSEPSIISLLALGVTDENLEKTKSSDQLAMEGYQAGSVILSQNPLQHELKKQLGINVRLSQTVDDTRNVILPRLVAEKQWTPQFSTSVGKTMGDLSARDANAEYKLNKHFSILGSYEGRDYDVFATSITNLQSTAPIVPQPSATTIDIFGLDLQFQLEFK